jgi:hypothetical protein
MLETTAGSEVFHIGAGFHPNHVTVFAQAMATGSAPTIGIEGLKYHGGRGDDP